METNERAINFYRKTGFSEEGRLKEFVFKDGKWLDVIVMGIIKRDEG
jgi:UDP-4-amino-4,6-dideoxy-N-acetyl-beta-L-altrosamine N-acetyltransferase